MNEYRAQVLVIDDDPAVVTLIDSVLDRTAYRLISAQSAVTGFELLKRTVPDMVILDYILPDAIGLDALQRIHQLYPSLPVIFLTTNGTAGTSIEAMKSGAYDCLRKPLDLIVLRQRIEEVCRHDRKPVESGETYDGDLPVDGLSLVGECDAMQEVFKAIGRLANQDDPLLIQGEIGTGKETVARAIHHHSHRASEPFVVIHGPAYQPARFDQEVFGLTSNGRLAIEDRVAGGTLLFQEVGCLPLAAQSNLWELLRTFADPTCPWQSTARVPFRVMATASSELRTRFLNGEFRADLYYLLTSRCIELPPLRQRQGDLPLLIGHVLAGLSRRSQGRESSQIADAARRILLAYSWPGNLDELLQVLKRAMAEGNGDVLMTPAVINLDLPRDLTPANELLAAFPEFNTNWSELAADRLRDGTENLYSEAQTEMESKLLALVMQHTQGNQAHAARILGMTRASLRKKLRLLKLSTAR